MKPKQDETETAKLSIGTGDAVSHFQTAPQRKGKSGSTSYGKHAARHEQNSDVRNLTQQLTCQNVAEENYFVPRFVQVSKKKVIQCIKNVNMSGTTVTNTHKK
jgi:hypothetical protein